jgi:hypothetical protein
VWRERDRLPARATSDPVAAPAGTTPPGAQRTVVDRRGEGGLGVLADLLSTTDPVLVACADVSRRRTLFERVVDPGRFGRPQVLYLSAHCEPEEMERRLAHMPDRVLCVADYAVIAARPALAASFKQLFVLDPAPSRSLDHALRCSAPLGAGGGDQGTAGPGAGEGWFLHVGFGEAEIDFARAALEHEHALRPALAPLYRRLSASPAGLAGTALESALAGEGRHPRTVTQAARCLVVLEEVGLAEVDPSSATVRCTMTSTGRVDLERSATYSESAGKREEGLSFLATLTETKGRRIAA